MATNAKPKLHITGSHTTDWRTIVRRQLGRYYDISDILDHTFEDAHGAAAASTIYLEDADVVLAYLAKNDADCHIAFAELASIADGSIVVLVDEWNDNRSRWLRSFVGPGKVFQTLSDAIDHLQTQLGYYRQIRNAHELMKERGGKFIKTRATAPKSDTSSQAATGKRRTRPAMAVEKPDQ